MVKVRVLSNFKHGGQSYYKDEIRILSEADAGYFCGVGWASADGFETGKPSLEDVKLDVHSVKHVTKGANING